MSIPRLLTDDMHQSGRSSAAPSRSRATDAGPDAARRRSTRRFGHRSNRRGIGAATGRDRGVALVEFAIIVPVLATLVFGSLELGFQWRFAHQSVSASSAGARSGAGLGSHHLADYEVLVTVRASLEAANQFDKLDRVIIYKANSAEGAPPAACLGDTFAVADCNVYKRGLYTSGGVTSAQFSLLTGCHVSVLTTNVPFRGWCPIVRNTDSTNAD